LGTACDILLLTVKFPRFLSKRGNILAGKEVAPGFDIVFVGRKKEVPQLHGLFHIPANLVVEHITAHRNPPDSHFARIFARK
jgi:hypothetical protein